MGKPVKIQVLCSSTVYRFYCLLADDADELTYDESTWDDLDENLDVASDLDREWQRRHDQFHTVIEGNLVTKFYFNSLLFHA